MSQVPKVEKVDFLPTLCAGREEKRKEWDNTPPFPPNQPAEVGP